VNGGEPGVVAITQRELLLVLRDDMRGLRTTVDEIAKDQALGAEGGMTQRGDVGGKERKTGRGERDSPATNDLLVVRLAEPPEPCEWLRSA
jgi:hypothetical protein